MYVVFTVLLYAPIYNFLPNLVTLNETTRVVITLISSLFLSFLIVETLKVAFVVALILGFILLLFIGISDQYTFQDLETGVTQIIDNIGAMTEPLFEEKKQK